jgi:hypothetical protein
MADNQANVQVNADVLVRKLRDKISDAIIQQAILEVAIEEGRERERILAESFQSCVKELDSLKEQVAALSAADMYSDDEDDLSIDEPSEEHAS